MKAVKLSELKGQFAIADVASSPPGRPDGGQRTAARVGRSVAARVHSIRIGLANRRSLRAVRLSVVNYTPSLIPSLQSACFRRDPAKSPLSLSLLRRQCPENCISTLLITFFF